MLRRSILFVLLSVGVLAFTSCSTQKRLSYFSSMGNQNDSAAVYNYHIHEARIVAGDMLIITVSGLDPLAVAPFNQPVVSYSAPGSDQLYNTPSLQSYLVDVNGNISFPVLGEIKLSGLTKSEAISLIKDRLAQYLKDPIVTIKFLNYKITVLGEVARPGQYTINNERVTILDALGMAGDMTPYGKRNTVLVTRENNGKLEFARLNLNSDDVFNSPYYFLQQNDVVYVEPNNVRAIASQNLSLYLSMITTLASLATVLVTVFIK
ncbi:MAG: polysaccharide export protein [Paludibacteraceae bacterium]|nr:polysaccharide export protein [Paludibacteraceae bacterium]MBO7259112.1 polysaccharide export protein [Paludibacteraceae bacterium]